MISGFGLTQILALYTKVEHVVQITKRKLYLESDCSSNRIQSASFMCMINNVFNSSVVSGVCVLSAQIIHYKINWRTDNMIGTQFSTNIWQRFAVTEVKFYYGWQQTLWTYKSKPPFSLNSTGPIQFQNQYRTLFTTQYMLLQSTSLARNILFPLSSLFTFSTKPNYKDKTCSLN